MQFTTRILGPFTRKRPSDNEQGDRRSGRRTLPIVAGATVLVLAGGTAAYAQVHKTVQLDVDGQVRNVGTFAGSVDALLADEGVRVGARDAVSATGGLSEGQDVVVRHAHQITVAEDGVHRSVWTTALTADEALDTLAARDASVSLVASRSSGGRADLPLDLVLHGSVDVLVDGKTLTGQDAEASVGQVLGELDVTLAPLDRVSVRQSETGRVEVVVNRVVVAEKTTHKRVGFDSTTKKDASRYEGTKVVTTEGKKGRRTIVTRVTTVDGKVTDRVKLSDKVTRKPVDEVVAIGTKERPVVVVPETTRSSSSSGSGSSSSGPIKAGGKADSLNWAALAACESGGNPRIVSSNGLYHGLYQFSVSTWHAVGGAGVPSQASASEQTARAKMLYNRSGAGQWPVCGKRLFS
ncbi:resuscitation-promoting factor [Cellulomonas edaphi]|uniref:Transglycosylase family protein n=1 Tax=Cellulomonas edaphi TaxID=3053468 RepID=A0ABT7S6I6_9CELL|nr:resuscitation-promoting factor [Cellulomons edaphi]MDM7830662.1 transglycosylase family protein [Cellulomons edaphi]